MTRYLIIAIALGSLLTSSGCVYRQAIAQGNLVEQEDLPVYTFPPDYISRLWSAIEKIDPVFAAAYRQSKSSQAAGDTR